MRSLEAFIEENGQWSAPRGVSTVDARVAVPDESASRSSPAATSAAPGTGSSSGWHSGAGKLGAMKVGVPSEVKPDEYRVGMTPAASASWSTSATRCSSRAAREGSSLADDADVAQGATILPDADAAFGEATMIVKVKEPQPEEVRSPRPHQVLFTYLHLAAEESLTRGLMESARPASRTRRSRTRAGGCRCWRRCPRSPARSQPRLARSCSRSRSAAAASCWAEFRRRGGQCDGDRRRRRRDERGLHRVGMEATVYVYDRNIDRLRELDIAFGGRRTPASRRRCRSRSGCPTSTS